MCVPSLGCFGTTFRCRLHQASLPWPLCQCWGLVPAALPLWLCCEPEAPSPAAHGPELPQRGEAQSQVCRTTVHPAWPPTSLCVCVRCSLHCRALFAGSRKLEYNGQTWHEHCFICSSCQQPIGSRSFIPDKKDYYCVPCYESKFAPRCTRCKKVHGA